MTKEDCIIQTTNDYVAYLRARTDYYPEKQVTVSQKWLSEQFGIAFKCGMRQGIAAMESPEQHLEDDATVMSLDDFLGEIITDLEAKDMELAAKVSYVLIDTVS